MHHDSYTILRDLANGREVLGINGALFSTQLRNAFAAGATAMDTLTAVRAALEQSSGASSVEGSQAIAASPLPPAMAVEEPAAEPQPVSTEPPVPTPAAVEESGNTAPASPETVAAEVPHAAPVDDRPEPMASQSDEPDASGWRPSEDAMLLDEYVGLGMSIAEVAINHGRDESDIAERLRSRHGLAIAEAPVTAESATAEPPAPPEPAPVVASQVESVEPAAPEPKGTPEAAGPVSKPEAEPALEDFEAVIAVEMRRASPDAVHFATGVLKHMERAPSAIGQLQAYLQSEKARTKLSDRLRLAMLAKVVAKLKAA